MSFKQNLLSLLFICFSFVVFAQLKTISGIVIANGDVEGIHILNKTASKYTVTDSDGSFEILARLNDTVVVSSLKYQMKEIVITFKTITEKKLRVILEETINQLDEVVVGKILTGNIGSDIGNIKLKEELNFYDLGIPGYTGKPKTVNERKLADADGGGPIYTGLGVNFHKLLNRISGRTKRLKERVILEENDKCMKQMKTEYSEVLFQNEILTEAQQAEYLYFCMDDEKFKIICNQNNPEVVLTFLSEKLRVYKSNLNSIKD